MAFGLGPDGFRRARYNDLVTQMRESAKDLFGENVRTEPPSFIGITTSIFAWFLAQLWAVSERVYNSAFIDTAEGINLDRVAKFIGLRRNPAVKATGEATFSGEDGTVIEEGFLVATEDEIRFKTTESGTIDAGDVTLNIRAIEPGTSGNVPAETITEIVNPIEGLDSVTNTQETTGGSEAETDPELRDRYIRSVSIGGSSTLDSIRATILDLENVRSASVIENNSIDTVDGRPPKSFESYALDGDEQEIAEAIFDTKPAGIETHGDITKQVIDDAGNEHDVLFSRPTEVTIYANITVTTNEEFPTDGEEQITTDFVRYVGGTDEDGEVYAGLAMGETMRYSKSLRSIEVEGIEDIELEISDDGETYIKDNIAIGPTEVAETSYDKVAITFA